MGDVMIDRLYYGFVVVGAMLITFLATMWLITENSSGCYTDDYSIGFEQGYRYRHPEHRKPFSAQKESNR
jgi:hypothetical protein